MKNQRDNSERVERGSKRQKAAYKITRNQFKDKETSENLDAHIPCPWNLVPDKATEKNKGRGYTVTVAIPGTIVAMAQSPELRTYLVGQIARAFTIFEVDEVVVYNDDPTQTTADTTSGVFNGSGKLANPSIFLARVLQYLETPSYLRKLLFPVHKDLKYAGLLNPLDAPHHMRLDEMSLYREGVVIDKPVKAGAGSFVTCGLKKDIKIDRHLKPGIRVTVELDLDQMKGNESVKNYRGKVVSPRQPREKHGLYWGYQIRIAKSISEVFENSSIFSSKKEEYDLTVGISDHGDDIYSLLDQFNKEEEDGNENEKEKKAKSKKDTMEDEDDEEDEDNKDNKNIPKFKHMLVVFGNAGGIESAVETDENIKITPSETKSLFDLWLNTCPIKGSRSIRLEEQLLITMSLLKPIILKKGY